MPLPRKSRITNGQAARPAEGSRPVQAERSRHPDATQPCGVPRRHPGESEEGAAASGASHPCPPQPRRGTRHSSRCPDGNVIPSSSCPLPGRTWGSGDNTSPPPPPPPPRQAGRAGAGPRPTLCRPPPRTAPGRKLATPACPPARAPRAPRAPAPAELPAAGKGGSAGADVTPGARRGVSPPRDPRGGRGASRDPRPPVPEGKGAAPPSSAAEPRAGSAPRRCRSAPSCGRDPRPAEPPCPAALSRLLPGPSQYPRRSRDRWGPFPSAAGVNRTLVPPAPPNFGVSPPRAVSLPIPTDGPEG
ncbi:basic proline-rich protein-like [Cinclus cinclus]|uniref:basic proline-rich protein-like n=1 Tax=Cinclus cinclus TaxID=127875 RepID=UPI002E0FE535